ncbi:MAG: flagellar filament capping protein FliD [Planctomycetota bacterium]|nr:flagellar filament capping protein FliD [Planctomycetota bacterium]
MVNSSGISFSGLASGLDTQAIVKQLLALERIPIQLLETKKQTAQKKLDKLGDFGAKLKDLQSKADNLATTDGFYAWAVQSSDPSVATINATGGAQSGVHTLEVLELAAVDRWAFDAVIDPSTDLATADGQQLVFEVGTTQYSLTINQSQSSLNEIASAIEDMVGDDVNAEVINAGTAGNPKYRLVLSSGQPGEDNRIANIVTDIPGLGLTYTPPDANGDPTSANNLTVGSNALVLVDDLPVERTTNDLSDVFEGLEINLLSTTEVGQPITFSIDPDKESMRENIDAFISSYNDVLGFINTQSSFTPAEEDGEAGTAGELFGDPILSRVRSTLNRALFYANVEDVANDTQGYSTLSLVGIKQGNDGTLSIDETRFDEKIAENIHLFADLFVDSDGFDNGDAEPNTEEFYTDTTADSGLAATLSREIDRMFGTYDGPIDSDTGDHIVLDALFDLKEDTIRDSMKRFDSQIETMERRLEGFERNLVLRFARLEELMAALNAQGAALSNAFA